MESPENISVIVISRKTSQGLQAIGWSQGENRMCNDYSESL